MSDNFVYISNQTSGPIEPPSLEEVAAFRGTEHVALIDDEEALISVTGGMLKYLGYQSATYLSATEFLESFTSAPTQYDIVLTDHLMPEMDGMVLIRHMREANASLPVVLCTGQCTPELREQLSSLGNSGLLSKPYTLPLLGEVVRKVLDNAKANKS